jgi:hypothetical protein
MIVMLGWRLDGGTFSASGEKGALECEQRHLWVSGHGKAGGEAGGDGMSRFGGWFVGRCR